MPPDAVSLSELAGAVAPFSPRMIGSDVTITDLHHDSREVRRGEGFVAITGTTVDGHDYVADAATAGAGAVVVERDVGAPVPQLLVTDTRAAMPWLAAEIHGHPSRSLDVVGVTGTNGKTTVAYMVEAMAAGCGRTGAVVGTVGSRIAGQEISIARTTPEATDLQRLLGDMVEAGVSVAALEVSSHALVLHRADAVRFAVVAFTNLSQDHLDFHGDLDAYFAAKLRLFDSGRAERAVIWMEDPAGPRIANSTDIDIITVGYEPGWDVSAAEVALSREGSEAGVEVGGASVNLQVPLPGRFNVANAMVALGCAVALDLPPAAAAAGLASMRRIPGRFEVVPSDHEFTVVVDYAHTPDAVSAVIKEAQLMVEGRVITVLGAAGDRDRTKRSLMGAAAASGDVAVITSDNPRTEDPWSIIAEVLRGAAGGVAEIIVESDRGSAIELAVDLARPDDIVLVLGKGHEQGQEIAGEVVPFEDRKAVEKALAGRIADWKPT